MPVDTTCLVIGAGVSGLAFANFVATDDVVIVEADGEIGGYCKTVERDGFVWDWSGHFFHFKHPDLERYLVERMPPGEVKVVQRQSRILFKDRLVDFPFQKNIHQLPQEDFVDCLYDLYFKDEMAPPHGGEANFRDMLYRKFGAGIADRFLIPYNEKLYACDLATLDVDAMGRFFPYAEVHEIIRNFKQADNRSYNATFTYPRGGAIQYVRALARDVPDERIALGEAVVSVDLARRVAVTTKREIRFEYLVSSAPFHRLVSMTGLDVPSETLSWNKVLVFNLGFDRKGWGGVHWVYFPERQYPFYRIGFYDNIFDTDRMSLYVELGYAADAVVDVDAALRETLAGLEAAGVVSGHRLIASHSVVMDPAYVHITKASNQALSEARAALAARGVYTIGRYGGWTYCSIEDNMIEARALARTLNRVLPVREVIA
ncbi:MAG: hypothetical protein AMXMBFR64_59150 [Myxococcales bacterium]